MVWLGRVWNAITDAVDGLKTLGVALLFMLLGLADYFDVVDVKPLLNYVFGENRAATIMIFMPFVFGTLRFMSTSGVKWSRSWKDEKWDKQANMDECNQTEEH